ncbi:MAG: ATPase [Bacteroidia bacterium]|nr:ATPase [Bacteroidia bacterium]
MKLTTFKYYIHDFFIKFRLFLVKFIDNVLFILSFIAFGSLIYKFGFPISQEVNSKLYLFYIVFANIVFWGLLIKILFIFNKIEKKRLILKLSILFLLLIIFIIRYFFDENVTGSIPVFDFITKNLILYLIIISVFIIEISQKSLKIFTGTINPALVFISSFFILILAGASLLLLPQATTKSISIVDALFTSTSAVCVTGLTVVDTATVFTTFGKAIVLILIQLGGLGVMTFTSFFGLFFMGSSSFKSNLYLKDFINTENLSDVFKSLLKILLITFGIEFTGAAIIFFNIDKEILPDILSRIGFSIFHSISAFCNAGFSTLSNNLYDINFRFNYNIHLIIAFLIILGGIGFPIIFNYYTLSKHFLRNIIRLLLKKQKRYYHVPRIININTRLALFTTIILLAGGTIIFFMLEYNNTLKEHNLYGKIVESFFHSTTPRTAGFNTLNMTMFYQPTALIIIFLMWIGASPCSTGGGIKTSSFAIAVLNIFSFAKGKDRIEVQHRQIMDDSVSKAFCTIILSLLVIGLSVLLVSSFDIEKNILDVAFECFSAFGTVGLSLGITSDLSVASKYIIIFTMFLGRVGILTIIVAFIRKVKSLSYEYPKENILVG